MATYRVWLTVKDRYGSIKELDGGIMKADLEKVSESELEALDKHFVTNDELNTATKTDDSLCYKGFFN